MKNDQKKDPAPKKPKEPAVFMVTLEATGDKPAADDPGWLHYRS